ncbi:MAG: acyl-CoA dehydrogenase family protein [Hyphomicrobiales bacterium]|nr:acyl-CoA dehydrogenase family protein [Hyphomicrobiales bacterium]
MDFDLSEEQRMLKDSVDRLVADKYDFDKRKAYLKNEHGFSREMWGQFAELGLLALPFAEADGGFGGGPVETMIVMESLGRALAVEPYLATVVLSGGIIRHAANDAQRAELVLQIAGGEKIFAFAHHERAARYNLARVSAKATKDGDGYILDGEKSLVLNGDAADWLIVSARVSGGDRDEDGIGLFLVDARAPGVSRRGFWNQDATRSAEISLSKVKVEAGHVLGEPGKAFPVIERVVHEAMAALCAEAVGGMGVAHADTVEYLKTRKQFGVTIGSFQSLQHRAVEMFVFLEQSRSITYFATMMASENDAAERARAMSAAKVQIGKSLRFVGQQSIQLHGGVGMTYELRVGHYFKRGTMIDTLFGDVDHHLAKLSAMGGLIAA